MNVSTKNYIELAGRTNVPNYEACRERLSEEFVQNWLDRSLANAVISNSELLDSLKKYTFYGKPFASILNTPPKNLDTSRLKTDTDVDIFHGILGIATEAGELLETLAGFLQGKDWDSVNLREEIGDVFWYCALIMKRLGLTFDDVCSTNIHKLAKRFPNGFTEFDANNRNLDSEREILEDR